MDGFERVSVHHSLTRAQLLMGCDRELFFSVTLLCGLLLMSGVTRGYWRNILLAVGLWVVGIPILAKVAIYDPNFKSVLLRGTRYLQVFLPANGKVGSLRPVAHKRWS
jgi:type IV secretory pathway TrbD component